MKNLCYGYILLFLRDPPLWGSSVELWSFLQNRVRASLSIGFGCVDAREGGYRTGDRPLDQVVCPHLHLAQCDGARGQFLIYCF